MSESAEETSQDVVESNANVITPEEAGYISQEDFIARVRAALTEEREHEIQWPSQVEGLIQGIDTGLARIEEELDSGGWARLRSSPLVSGSLESGLRIGTSLRSNLRIYENVKNNPEDTLADLEGYLRQLEQSVGSGIKLLERLATVYYCVKFEIFVRNMILRNKLANANWARLMRDGGDLSINTSTWEALRAKVAASASDEIPFSCSSIYTWDVIPSTRTDRTNLFPNQQNQGSSIIADFTQDEFPVVDSHRTNSMAVTFWFPSTAYEALKRYVDRIQELLRANLNSTGTASISVRSRSLRGGASANIDYLTGCYSSTGEPIIIPTSSALRRSLSRYMGEHCSVQIVIPQPNSCNPITFYCLEYSLQIMKTLRRKQLCSLWRN